MRIAVLGGTGSFGRALALRLREAGYDVCIGSREAGRAAEAAAELGCDGRENAGACAGADLIVLATKAEATLDTARELRAAIGATPVLCVAAELSFGPRGAEPTSQATSIAQRVQDLLDAPVTAGLHSLAARNLGADRPPDEDTFVCGDDEAAKALALDVAEAITAGRAVDAGPLASARALEGLTAVIVNVNKRYRAHAGVRVTGLP